MAAAPESNGASKISRPSKRAAKRPYGKKSSPRSTLVKNTLAFRREEKCLINSVGRSPSSSGFSSLTSLLAFFLNYHMDVFELCFTVWSCCMTVCKFSFFILLRGLLHILDLFQIDGCISWYTVDSDFVYLLYEKLTLLEIILLDAWNKAYSRTYNCSQVWTKSASSDNEMDIPWCFVLQGGCLKDLEYLKRRLYGQGRRFWRLSKMGHKL